METSDWLTIFSLVFAVLALYPFGEREIINLKMHWVEKMLIILSFLFMLFLTKFYEMAETFPFLNFFTIEDGVEPKNLALLVFLGSATCIWVLLFNLVPFRLANNALIEYYSKMILHDKQSFSKVFFKYEKHSPNILSYDKLFSNTFFINTVIDNLPDFTTDIFNNLDQHSFADLLNNQLANNNSILMQELRRNDENESILSENTLLQQLINDNLKQFIHYSGFKILTDKCKTVLQNEKNDPNSIYLQNHLEGVNNYNTSIWLYNVLTLMKLIYVIPTKNDIRMDNLSRTNKPMVSVYSSICQQIIDNMSIVPSADEINVDSNYHFVIEKCFENLEDKMRVFLDLESTNDHYFLETHLPHAFGSAMSKLLPYLGIHFSDTYISNIYQYHLFPVFFDNRISETMKSEIYSKCIKIINTEHLPVLLINPINEFCDIYGSQFIEQKYDAKYKETLDYLHQKLSDDGLI